MFALGARPVSDRLKVGLEVHCRCRVADLRIEISVAVGRPPFRKLLLLLLLFKWPIDRVRSNLRLAEDLTPKGEPRKELAEDLLDVEVIEHDEPKLSRCSQFMARGGGLTKCDAAKELEEEREVVDVDPIEEFIFSLNLEEDTPLLFILK
jgi:hypothetical protein